MKSSQIIVLIVSFVSVSTNDLSLHLVDANLPEIVFRTSSRKAFCFPNEEVMGIVANEANNHNWGFTMNPFNYSSALFRVGQVMCRQLGFSFLDSISSVDIKKNSYQRILWAASCLGYEPLVSHCFYQEFDDLSLPCQSYVGLKCGNCHKDLVLTTDRPYAKINSPGFPYSYADNAFCEWRISSKSINFHSFSVKLESFSLPKPNLEGNCANGFLEIVGYSSNSVGFIISEILCGTLPSKEIIVNGSFLIFRWNAGIFHPRPNSDLPPGFQLVVEAAFVGNANGKLLASDYQHRSQNMTVAHIVGIAFGVLLIMSLLLLAFLGCRFMLRKRAEYRSRHAMAERIESRRNNFPGCNSSMMQQPQQQNVNSFEFNIAHGDLSRTSISSAVYEEWNPDFLNDSFNKVQYLMLEEAIRRKTLSPQLPPNQDQENSNSNRNLESAFKFPIPIVKVTGASDWSSNSQEEHGFSSETSDLSSFCGSVGSNNVFGEAIVIPSQPEFLPSNIDACRKSTYTININDYSSSCVPNTEAKPMDKEKEVVWLFIVSDVFSRFLFTKRTNAKLNSTKTAQQHEMLTKLCPEDLVQNTSER